MPRILVVEDSHTQALLIRFLLQKAQFDVEVAGNGIAALQALEAARPDLVLTDLQMPEMNGLDLVRALQQRHPEIPVVLMTGGGCDDLALQALRAGAAHYASKQLVETDIVGTVEKVLRTSRAVENQHFWQQVTQSELRVVLENDPAAATSFISRIQNDLAQLQLCRGTVRVGVALTEAISNAIFHGNLAAGMRPRSGDVAAFDQLCALRRSQSPYLERRVHVQALLSRSEATFVIRDEGSGFDVSSCCDPLESASIEKASGRGVLLMRTFMDKVFYNPVGNEVTLVKHRDMGVGQPL